MSNYKGTPSSSVYRAVPSSNSLAAVPSNAWLSGTPSSNNLWATFCSDNGISPTTYFSWITDPGIKNLGTALTINGSTKEAVFRLEGKDASSTAWNSTIGSYPGTRIGTAGTSYNHPCPWNQSEQFVQMQGYDIYRYGDVLNAEEDDLVIEGVCMAGGSGATNFLAKYNASSPFEGWRIYSSATSIVASIRSTDGSTITNPSANIGDAYQNWFHFIVFFDNTAGCTIYINGGAVSATSTTALNESASSPGLNLEVGSSIGPGAALAYLQIWKATAWLDTHVQPTIARERFNAFAGLVAQTGVGSKHPVSVSRSTQAAIPYVRSAANEESFYYAAPGWITGTRMLNSAGAPTTGVYIQPSQANTWTTTYNHGASFTTTRATSFNLSTTQYSPLYNWFCNAFIGTAVDNTHGWSYNVASSTTGVHWLHTWYRPGNKTWIKLQSTGAAAASCYFNCSGAGTVGTADAGILTSAIRRYYDQAGNAWYLCYITYNGTNAAHDHDVLICDGDGDDTYAGDASTVNGYAFATGHGVALTAITSPIPTRAAGVTRPIDVLTFNGTGNIAANAGYAKIVSSLPDISLNNLERTIFEAGSSANEKLTILDTTTNYLTASGLSGGAGQFMLPATTTVTTAEVDTSELEWSSNRFAYAVDGTAATGSPDTSGSTPSSIGIMNVGTTIASGVAGACLIGEITIKDFK